MRPSALAVLRLMTISNLLGWMTGRSPGLGTRKAIAQQLQSEEMVARPRGNLTGRRVADPRSGALPKEDLIEDFCHLRCVAILPGFAVVGAS